QVAAHLTGLGLEVTLLDIVPAGSPDRNALGKRALDVLKKAKPSPVHVPEDLSRLRIGNFEDDWKAVGEADWVSEAVVEDLEIKRQLFTRVAATLKKTAFLTSNTSGLPIASMSEALPAD